MNKNIKYSQNFLTSEKVLNQIIKQLNLKETDTVYEIGTGKGHLTTKLAKISKQVTSIELDSHLFNLSSEKLKLNTRVTLIHQDILQFQFPNKQRYKIVGSIPYGFRNKRKSCMWDVFTILDIPICQEDSKASRASQRSR